MVVTGLNRPGRGEGYSSGGGDDVRGWAGGLMGGGGVKMEDPWRWDNSNIYKYQT